MKLVIDTEEGVPYDMIYPIVALCLYDKPDDIDIDDLRYQEVIRAAGETDSGDHISRRGCKEAAMLYEYLREAEEAMCRVKVDLDSGEENIKKAIEESDDMIDDMFESAMKGLISKVKEVNK